MTFININKRYRIQIRATIILLITTFGLQDVAFALPEEKPSSHATLAPHLATSSPEIKMRADGSWDVVSNADGNTDFRTKWLIVDISFLIGQMLKLAGTHDTGLKRPRSILIPLIKRHVRTMTGSETMPLGFDIDALEEIREGETLAGFALPIRISGIEVNRFTYSLTADPTAAYVTLKDGTKVYITSTKGAERAPKNPHPSDSLFTADPATGRKHLALYPKITIGGEDDIVAGTENVYADATESYTGLKDDVLIPELRTLVMDNHSDQLLGVHLARELGYLRGGGKTLIHVDSSGHHDLMFADTRRSYPKEGTLADYAAYTESALNWKIPIGIQGHIAPLVYDGTISRIVHVVNDEDMPQATEPITKRYVVAIDTDTKIGYPYSEEEIAGQRGDFAGVSTIVEVEVVMLPLRMLKTYCAAIAPEDRILGIDVDTHVSRKGVVNEAALAFWKDRPIEYACAFFATSPGYAEQDAAIAFTQEVLRSWRQRTTSDTIAGFPVTRVPSLGTLVKAHLAGREAINAFDLGAGNGIITGRVRDLLSSLFTHVTYTGIERDGEKVAAALDSGERLIAGDLTDAALRRSLGQADLITACNPTPHNIGIHAAAIRTMTAPGGIGVILFAQADFAELARGERVFNTIDTPDICHALSDFSLIEFPEGSGVAGLYRYAFVYTPPAAAPDGPIANTDIPAEADLPDGAAEAIAAFNHFDHGLFVDRSSCAVERITAGHINDTYLLTYGRTGKRFIVQKLNPIFDHTEIDTNLQIFERAQQRATALPPYWQKIHYYTSINTFYKLFYDESGAIWRVMEFVPGDVEIFNSFSEIPEADRIDAARSLGEAIALFGHILASIPHDAWRKPLPHFHDTRYHYAYLQRILAGKESSLALSTNRAITVRMDQEIRQRYADRIDTLRAKIEQHSDLTTALDGLERCTTHGDVKINNAVFGRDSAGKLVCRTLLDLDTIQAGSIIDDLGDALRSAGNPAGEEPASIDDVQIDTAVVRAIIDGYIARVRELAGDARADELAAHAITAYKAFLYTLCMHFFADALVGNQYFRLKEGMPEDRNLYRAEVQMRALEELEKVENDFATDARRTPTAASRDGATVARAFLERLPAWQRNPDVFFRRIARQVPPDEGMAPFDADGYLTVPYTNKLVEAARAGNDLARHYLLFKNYDFIHSLVRTHLKRNSALRRYARRLVIAAIAGSNGRGGFNYAIDHHDPSRGAKLTSYAYHPVRNGIIETGNLLLGKRRDGRERVRRTPAERAKQEKRAATTAAKRREKADAAAEEARAQLTRILSSGDIPVEYATLFEGTTRVTDQAKRMYLWRQLTALPDAERTFTAIGNHFGVTRQNAQRIAAEVKEKVAQAARKRRSRRGWGPGTPAIDQPMDDGSFHLTPKVTGETVGKLRIIPDIARSYKELWQVRDDEVVAVDFYPTEDPTFARPMGIVTTVETGGLSHAEVRARFWGIPHAVFGTLDGLRALEGEWVYLKVDEADGSAFMRLATDDEIANYESYKPKPPTPKLAAVSLATTKPVIPWAEATDPKEVSHKFASLHPAAEAAHAALYHPLDLTYIVHPAAGDVIPYATYQRLLEANPGTLDEIRRIIGTIDHADLDDIEMKLATIRSLITHLTIPPELWEGTPDKDDSGRYTSQPSGIESTVYNYTGGYPGTKRVFIRTGTNAEDHPDYPGFGAGLYGTIPNVGRDDAAEAIKKAWASVWNLGAYLERQKLGLDHFAVYPAVQISEAIDADYAFVIHTAHTGGGDTDTVIIEIVQGLGEGLVDDNRYPGNPHRYYYSKSRNAIIGYEEADKAEKAVFNPAGGMGRAPTDYSDDPFSREREGLPLALALGRMAWAIERRMGRPQDIEGALRIMDRGKQNHIYIMQSRSQVGYEPLPTPYDEYAREHRQWAVDFIDRYRADLANTLPSDTFARAASNLLLFGNEAGAGTQKYQAAEAAMRIRLLISMGDEGAALAGRLILCGQGIHGYCQEIFSRLTPELQAAVLTNAAVDTEMLDREERSFLAHASKENIPRIITSRSADTLRTLLPKLSPETLAYLVTETIAFYARGKADWEVGNIRIHANDLAEIVGAIYAAYPDAEKERFRRCISLDTASWCGVGTEYVPAILTKDEQRILLDLHYHRDRRHGVIVSAAAVDRSRGLDAFFSRCRRFNNIPGEHSVTINPFVFILLMDIPGEMKAAFLRRNGLDGEIFDTTLTPAMLSGQTIVEMTYQVINTHRGYAYKEAIDPDEIVLIGDAALTARLATPENGILTVTTAPQAGQLPTALTDAFRLLYERRAKKEDALTAWLESRGLDGTKRYDTYIYVAERYLETYERLAREGADAERFDRELYRPFATDYLGPALDRNANDVCRPTALTSFISHLAQKEPTVAGRALVYRGLLALWPEKRREIVAFFRNEGFERECALLNLFTTLPPLGSAEEALYGNAAGEFSAFAAEEVLYPHTKNDLAHFIAYDASDDAVLRIIRLLYATYEAHPHETFLSRNDAEWALATGAKNRWEPYFNRAFPSSFVNDPAFSYFKRVLHAAGYDLVAYDTIKQDGAADAYAVAPLPSPQEIRARDRRRRAEDGIDIDYAAITDEDFLTNALTIAARYRKAYAEPDEIDIYQRTRADDDTWDVSAFVRNMNERHTLRSYLYEAQDTIEYLWYADREAIDADHILTPDEALPPAVDLLLFWITQRRSDPSWIASLFEGTSPSILTTLVHYAAQYETNYYLPNRQLDDQEPIRRSFNRIIALQSEARRAAIERALTPLARDFLKSGPPEPSDAATGHPGWGPGTPHITQPSDRTPSGPAPQSAQGDTLNRQQGEIEFIRPLTADSDIVIWDWDRTIFDPGELTGGTIHEDLVAEIMAIRRGGRPEEYLAEAVELFRNTQGMTNLERFEMVIEREQLKGKLDPQAYDDRCTATVRDYVATHLDRWRDHPEGAFVPGALALMRELHRRGVKQYIVTGNSWLNKERADYLGIGDLIDGIYGKAAWDGPGKCTKIKAFGRIFSDHPGRNVVVIGDGTGELALGRSLAKAAEGRAVFTIGLAYPPGASPFSPDIEDLRRTGPDAIIHGGGYADPAATADALRLTGVPSHEMPIPPASVNGDAPLMASSFRIPMPTAFKNLFERVSDWWLRFNGIDVPQTFEAPEIPPPWTLVYRAIAPAPAIDAIVSYLDSRGTENGTDRMPAAMKCNVVLKGDVADIVMGPLTKQHASISIESHYGIRVILVRRPNGALEFVFETPLKPSSFMHRKFGTRRAISEQNQRYRKALAEEMRALSRYLLEGFRHRFGPSFDARLVMPNLAGGENISNTVETSLAEAAGASAPNEHTDTRRGWGPGTPAAGQPFDEPSDYPVTGVDRSDEFIDGGYRVETTTVSLGTLAPLEIGRATKRRFDFAPHDADYAVVRLYNEKGEPAAYFVTYPDAEGRLSIRHGERRIDLPKPFYKRYMHTADTIPEKRRTIDGKFDSRSFRQAEVMFAGAVYQHLLGANEDRALAAFIATLALFHRLGLTEITAANLEDVLVVEGYPVQRISTGYKLYRHYHARTLDLAARYTDLLSEEEGRRLTAFIRLMDEARAIDPACALLTPRTLETVLTGFDCGERQISTDYALYQHYYERGLDLAARFGGLLKENDNRGMLRAFSALIDEARALDDTTRLLTPQNLRELLDRSGYRVTFLDNNYRIYHFWKMHGLDVDAAYDATGPASGQFDALLAQVTAHGLPPGAFKADIRSYLYNILYQLGKFEPRQGKQLPVTRGGTPAGDPSADVPEIGEEVPTQHVPLGSRISATYRGTALGLHATPASIAITTCTNYLERRLSPIGRFSFRNAIVGLGTAHANKTVYIIPYARNDWATGYRVIDSDGLQIGVAKDGGIAQPVLKRSKMRGGNLFILDGERYTLDPQNTATGIILTPADGEDWASGIKAFGADGSLLRNFKREGNATPLTKLQKFARQHALGAADVERIYRTYAETARLTVRKHLERDILVIRLRMNGKTHEEVATDAAIARLSQDGRALTRARIQQIEAILIKALEETVGAGTSRKPATQKRSNPLEGPGTPAADQPPDHIFSDRYDNTDLGRLIEQCRPAPDAFYVTRQTGRSGQFSLAHPKGPFVLTKAHAKTAVFVVFNDAMDEEAGFRVFDEDGIPIARHHNGVYTKLFAREKTDEYGMFTYDGIHYDLGSDHSNAPIILIHPDTDGPERSAPVAYTSEGVRIVDLSTQMAEARREAADAAALAGWQELFHDDLAVIGIMMRNAVLSLPADGYAVLVELIEIARRAFAEDPAMRLATAGALLDRLNAHFTAQRNAIEERVFGALRADLRAQALKVLENLATDSTETCIAADALLAEMDTAPKGAMTTTLYELARAVRERLRAVRVREAERARVRTVVASIPEAVAREAFAAHGSSWNTFVRFAEQNGFGEKTKHARRPSDLIIAANHYAARDAEAMLIKLDLPANEYFNEAQAFVSHFTGIDAVLIRPELDDLLKELRARIAAFDQALKDEEEKARQAAELARLTKAVPKEDLVAALRAAEGEVIEAARALSTDPTAAEGAAETERTLPAIKPAEIDRLIESYELSTTLTEIRAARRERIARQTKEDRIAWIRAIFETLKRPEALKEGRHTHTPAYIERALSMIPDLPKQLREAGIDEGEFGEARRTYAERYLLYHPGKTAEKETSARTRTKRSASSGEGPGTPAIDQGPDASPRDRAHELAHALAARCPAAADTVAIDFNGAGTLDAFIQTVAGAIATNDSTDGAIAFFNLPLDRHPDRESSVWDDFVAGLCDAIENLIATRQGEEYYLLPFIRDALSEAVRNAAIWGNRARPESAVLIAWRLESNALIVDIVDEGTAPIDFTRRATPPAGVDHYWYGAHRGYTDFLAPYVNTAYITPEGYDHPLTTAGGERLGQDLELRFELKPASDAAYMAHHIPGYVPRHHPPADEKRPASGAPADPAPAQPVSAPIDAPATDSPNAAAVFATFATTDEAHAVATMTDALGVSAADTVLVVGAGMVALHPLACVVRGAQVDVVQPPTYHGDVILPQTEELQGLIDSYRVLFRSRFGRDLIGDRIDLTSYQTRVERAGLPPGRYTYAMLPMVLNDPYNDRAASERIVTAVLASLTDTATVVVIDDHPTRSATIFKQVAGANGYHVTGERVFPGAYTATAISVQRIAGEKDPESAVADTDAALTRLWQTLSPDNRAAAEEAARHAEAALQARIAAGWAYVRVGGEEELTTFASELMTRFPVIDTIQRALILSLENIAQHGNDFGALAITAEDLDGGSVRLGFTLLDRGNGFVDGGGLPIPIPRAIRHRASFGKGGDRGVGLTFTAEDAERLSITTVRQTPNGPQAATWQKGAAAERPLAAAPVSSGTRLSFSRTIAGAVVPKAELAIDEETPPDTLPPDPMTLVTVGRHQEGFLSIAPSKKSTIEEEAVELAGRIDRALAAADMIADEIVKMTVFIADERELPGCEAFFRRHYSPSQPLISFVCQPPINGNHLAIEMITAKGDDLVIKPIDPQMTIVEDGAMRWAYVANIRPDPGITDPDAAARDVYRKMRAKLEANGFAMEQVVRFWNYIGNIVGEEGGAQQYQIFNDVRGEVFAPDDPTRRIRFGKNILANGQDATWPAATGIGTNAAHLSMECLALMDLATTAVLYPLENPNQTPAFNYDQGADTSAAVLKTGLDTGRKTPPLFSRGMLIRSAASDIGRIIISGTASILNKKTVFPGDVEGQTRLSIENMAAVLGEGGGTLKDVCQLRAYVKNRADYEKVKAIMDAAFGDTPCTYTIADVCRDDLLVEIEGIAYVKQKKVEDEIVPPAVREAINDLWVHLAPEDRAACTDAAQSIVETLKREYPADYCAAAVGTASNLHHFINHEIRRDGIEEFCNALDLSIENVEQHGGDFGALILRVHPLDETRVRYSFVLLDRGEGFIDKDGRHAPIHEAIETGRSFGKNGIHGMGLTQTVQIADKIAITAAERKQSGSAAYYWDEALPVGVKGRKIESFRKKEMPLAQAPVPSGTKIALETDRKRPPFPVTIGTSFHIDPPSGSATAGNAVTPRLTPDAAAAVLQQAAEAITRDLAKDAWEIRTAVERRRSLLQALSDLTEPGETMFCAGAATDVFTSWAGLVMGLETYHNDVVGRLTGIYRETTEKYRSLLHLASTSVKTSNAHLKRLASETGLTQIKVLVMTDIYFPFKDVDGKDAQVIYDFIGNEIIPALADNAILVLTDTEAKAIRNALGPGMAMNTLPYEPLTTNGLTEAHFYRLIKNPQTPRENAQKDDRQREGESKAARSQQPLDKAVAAKTIDDLNDGITYLEQEGINNNRPIIFALGRDWMKGYSEWLKGSRRGESAYEQFNALLSRTRGYLAGRKIVLVDADDDRLLQAIADARAESGMEDAKVVALASFPQGADPDTSVLAAIKKEYADAFVAGVDDTELRALTQDYLFRVVEAIDLTLRLAFDVPYDPNPNIAIDTKRPFPVLIPTAEPIDTDEAMEAVRHFYLFQRSA